MVIEFVTSRCCKSHELAQASLLCGTVAQVSDVAYGPLVIHLWLSVVGTEIYLQLPLHVSLHCGLFLCATFLIHLS